MWQVFSSSEPNMQDLEAWMLIRAAVMWIHSIRRCHHDALKKSTEDAWSGYFSPVVSKLFIKGLESGVGHIVEGRDGKLLVKSLFSHATIIDLTI